MTVGLELKSLALPTVFSCYVNCTEYKPVVWLAAALAIVDFVIRATTTRRSRKYYYVYTSLIETGNRSETNGAIRSELR